MSDVTHILNRIENGEDAAAKQLLPMVYDELRKLASAKMADERHDHTLQGTALVHEAYLRLVDVDRARHWDSRGHFFAAAAEAMRRLLIERARKRGRREALLGPPIPLEDLADATSFPDDQLLRLDEALESLNARNPAAAELVKLRFFAGLTMPAAADTLGVPLRSAERTWTYARTWLHRALEQSPE